MMPAVLRQAVQLSAPRLKPKPAAEIQKQAPNMPLLTFAFTRTGIPGILPE
jgi:hypothetical protein